MKLLRDYENRPVKLTDERREHILLHAEMAGMDAEIEQTVSNPQCVVRSRSDPTAELFYRFYRRTILGDKWLCVVIKYRQSDAFILTSYLTDRVKSGEQIWPRT
jgi:hypothetical protein